MCNKKNSNMSIDQSCSWPRKPLD